MAALPGATIVVWTNFAGGDTTSPSRKSLSNIPPIIWNEEIKFGSALPNYIQILSPVEVFNEASRVKPDSFPLKQSVVKLKSYIIK